MRVRTSIYWVPWTSQHNLQWCCWWFRNPANQLIDSRTNLTHCLPEFDTPWKINGWNLQPPPMKRKENDLNQTSTIMFFQKVFGCLRDNDPSLLPHPISACCLLPSALLGPLPFVALAPRRGALRGLGPGRGTARAVRCGKVDGRIVTWIHHFVLLSDDSDWFAWKRQKTANRTATLKNKILPYSTRWRPPTTASLNGATWVAPINDLMNR